MRGLDWYLFLVFPVWLSWPVPGGVLGYAGLGPGMELIPYFMGLLAWVGMAFGAILLWPLTVLFRLFRKTKVNPTEEMKNESIPAKAPETLG